MAPDFCGAPLAKGVSIALTKGGSGVRPLKCCCLGASDEIAHFCRGKNFGVGCPGGVEVVGHSLRDVLRTARPVGVSILKIDFSNAFNRVDRQSFMRATSKGFPGWKSMLLYDHSETIESSSGVQ